MYTVITINVTLWLEFCQYYIKYIAAYYTCNVKEIIFNIFV